jgi:hypothetical protein
VTQHPLAPLAAYRQFVTVKLVPLPNGKTDKLPVSPFGQVGVDAHSPANWQTWQDAQHLAQGLGSSYTVGFVLTANDPFFCLDIDGALMPDGSWSPLSQQLVAALPGCVVEVSQSGRGLHVWGAGPVPEHTMKNVPLGIEFYSSLRFIALGSSHVGQMVYPNPHVAAVCARFFPPKADAADIPDEGPREDWIGPADDDELIQRALGSTSMRSALAGRATFADLWNANVEVLARSYPSDTSEWDGSSADAALAQHLAFWTGCDVARIERLMRRSSLVRDKWDDRADYLVQRTIMGACGQARDVYRDPAEVERRARAAAASTPTPSDSSIAPPAGVPAVPGASDALPTMRNSVGLAATSGRVALDTVRQGVRELQLHIAHDEFTGRHTIRDCTVPGSVPVPIEAHHTIRVRERMGLGGAKAVSSEIMKDVIELEAQEHRYDSAIQWAQSLQHDGVPRVETFLAKYWGVVDTPYTRAVSRYLWTALAGRLLRPGIKADMALILVGEQGPGKSSGIASLVPNPEFFAELDLDKDESDLGRQMKGKLVCELPELRGMSSKDRRHTKAFIARAVDEWVPKFKEDAGRFPRRCLLIGTTNEDEFLNDPTGERRYLPARVGVMDNAAVRRDLEQLWAEGIARFLANGIEWQDAQHLAVEVHPEFTITDPLEGSVRSFIERNVGPVILAKLYMTIYQKPVIQAQRAEQLRLTDILKKLGFANKNVRIDGEQCKAWVPKGVPTPPAS